MRPKKKNENKKHVYFDRAFGALIGYLQSTPPAQNLHTKDTTHKVICKDKVNAEVGCVIGREHARAQSQHASGASGLGRIVSILAPVEKNLFFQNVQTHDPLTCTCMFDRGKVCLD